MATFAAQPKSDFAIWEVPGRSRRIVYSTALMRQLAAEASEESARTPGGGREVGGVLFGTADDYEVRIVAYRPIRCGYSNGPEFLLSSEDEQALRTQLTSATSDPLLGGLVVVGWFHSHTKTPICLTAEDMRLWEIYFPMPWQVALVLRPQKSEPTRAGFFFRPASGPVRTDSSYRVFEADAELPATPVQDLADAIDAKQQQPAAAPAPESPKQPAEDVQEPPPELPWHDPPSPSRRVLWLVCGVAAAIAAIAGLTLYRGPASRPAPTAQAKLPDLDLRIHRDESGQLSAIWDRTSPMVTRAMRGTLEMSSGADRTDLPLSPEVLGAGKLPILSGRDVRIRLILDSLDSDSRQTRVEAAAYYLGAGPSVAGKTPPTPSTPATPLEAEVMRLEKELIARRVSNDLLSSEVDALDAAEAAALSESPVENSPAALPPATPPVATAVVKPEPTPVALQTAPTAPPSPVSLPPAPVSLPPPQPVAPEPAKPAAPPPPPVYSGPRSGRVIWTGLLSPGGSITINARAASAGTVNATLPGVPVRLSIYPAEFTSSGITIFSANPRHASNDVTEGTSARNGWMNTRYIYDAERARDAQLTSSPAEDGAYKRFTIRGGSRPVAAVVIDWQVAQ